jgi:hypothetical protein
VHIVVVYYKNISQCTVLWLSHFFNICYTADGDRRNYTKIHREHICGFSMVTVFIQTRLTISYINPLNAELNSIFCLQTLLGAHHFLHVNRIRVKSLILRLRMPYIYIYIYIVPILDVSRSHTTTHHSR